MVWATPAALPFLGISVATWALVACLQPRGQEGLSALSKGLLSFLRLRQLAQPWLPAGQTPQLLPKIPQGEEWDRDGRERPKLLPTYVPQGVGGGEG